MMQRGRHVRRKEKCLFCQNRPCYQVCDPECAPLLVKQALDLTLDTTIMQSFLCFLSSHFHLLMHTAFLPSFSNWSLKVTLLTGGWRSTLQALIVWWIKQLQSQSKITPPQASLLPWIPRFICLRRPETMTCGCLGVPSLLPNLLDSQTGISSCDESQAVTAQRSRACHLWLRQIYSRS